ncbi:DUF4132 domain-containing protein [Streptomyces sp. NBC_00091]|uniref:DUF4132 domain-containing protein n=1 Tax=Streptomyces sp. NBC_00091 TaxID=2975648 RepID=UPI00224D5FC0|nr:DUF4132 domain-containing protein [Streptomyces sp. NBC_00091]MCX5380515.1 DUF4132 domain-containing protein [Streptomyces sp. NBC_00091]
MRRWEQVGGGSSVGAEVPAAADPVDEDLFILPTAWKRNLHPRRGGVPRTVPGLDTEAQEKLRQWLEADAEAIERVLGSAKTGPELTRAARAHQGGSPSPLGAAVLAALVTPREGRYPVTADAWAGLYGLPFAACAAVEALELRATWSSVNRKSHLDGVETRPEQSGNGWSRHGAQFILHRLRALLSVADEETYRAAVEALARHRQSPRRRVATAFLVPSEQRWVDECCADPAAREHEEHLVRELLLCSLGSAGQVGLFGGRVELGWRAWNASVIATVAEGVGTAMAPLLAGELNQRNIDTDETKALAGALGALPCDEAFGFLLDRVQDKHVRAPLVAAAHRCPQRALRMLARASLGSGRGATMAGQLLQAHVAAHRDLALAALPGLPGPLAEAVAPLAHRYGLVEEAPAQALPPLLTSPPWTRKRTVVKPRVVSGLVAEPVTRVVWQAGEREAWAKTQSWVSAWQPYAPMEQLVQKLRTGRLDKWHAVGVFTHGPVEDVRPLLPGWTGPGHAYDGPALFKPLVARHEVAALPVAMRMASGHPTTMAPVLRPFLDADVARLMAEWLVRLKVAGETARSWFVRHGADAARLLVPDALGALGPERTAAERALSVVASAHGAEVVRGAAAGFGPEAAEAIEQLLSVDPLVAALPARMPKVGQWAVPQVLPQILLKSGGALPPPAVGHVLTMLALSTPSSEYPGLEQLRELCTRESLTAFVWALFTEWQLAGMSPREAWALHALGRFGDDETVRALTPVIRAWPGEGAHQRAVDGLEVLASIGSDVALLHLHGIAQRVKFKALKLRAQEKIAAVAAELGLTDEQLSDRLVPDLGLDAAGSTVLDYGTRRFTVGFDELLRPFVLDEGGRRLRDLPKPGARDDAELAPAERKRFAALKKDVRTIASGQVRRLEAAMVAGRSWTGAEFRELFVTHPLVWHLVRRLVWLARDGDAVTAFRVAEDRTYADVKGAAVEVADDARVTLAHPLHLQDALAAWTELFAGHEIVQPFPQLGRSVMAVTEEEAGGARLTRFEGVTVPVGRLLALQQRGWERGEPQDAGVERWFSRRLGPECHLVIALDEGIAVGMIAEFPDQKLETIWLDSMPGDHWQSRTYPLRFGDLDPVLVSEVLVDLTELTS